MINRAALRTDHVREVVRPLRPIHVFHCCAILLVSLTYDLELELAALNLRVDLLPQILAFLRPVRLDHVDARHLIDGLGELLRAVAIRGSQVPARGVREIGAAAVAVGAALPMILREMPWRHLLIVERLVVQSDGRDLQLTAAHAHLASRRAGMRVLLQLLLIEVTVQSPWTLHLCGAQGAQIERVRQVEVGDLVDLATGLDPRTHLIQVGVGASAQVPGHSRIKNVQLVLVLDRGEVRTATSERADHVGRRHRPDPRTAPLHRHEGAVRIEHQVIL